MPDPMRQYWSPYVAFGNNPINVVDPRGGEGDPVIGQVDGNRIYTDTGWITMLGEVTIRPSPITMPSFILHAQDMTRPNNVPNMFDTKKYEEYNKKLEYYLSFTSRDGGGQGNPGRNIAGLRGIAKNYEDVDNILSAFGANEITAGNSQNLLDILNIGAKHRDEAHKLMNSEYKTHLGNYFDPLDLDTGMLKANGSNYRRGRMIFLNNGRIDSSSWMNIPVSPPANQRK